MRIRITSENGVVRYQVIRRMGSCWLIEGTFRTRREAKRYIEDRRREK